MSTRASRGRNQEESAPAEEVHSKTCFIVAPIGSEGTEVRRSTEGLLKAVLKPVLNAYGFNVVIAHEISTLGSITDQVVNNLLEADLVVADLSGLNPNVMYELAIRHCAALPVIVIANRDTKLPFDVVIERTVFYSDDMYGGVDLAKELEKLIEKIGNNSTTPDNPVTRAKRSESVRAKLMTKEDSGDIGKYLLDRMDKLESLIGRMSGGRDTVRLNKFNSSIQDISMSIPEIRDSLLSADLPLAEITMSASKGLPALEMLFERGLSDIEELSVSRIMSGYGIRHYSWFIRSK